MTFWESSLALYRRPGVPEACLRLQDRDGLDVNLVLWCVWLGVTGRPLDEDLLGRAMAAVAPWRARAVLPLRERSTTVAWLTALGLAWTASATGSWLSAAGAAVWEHQVLATRIAWWAGCSFALVAMLAATRSVIRDVSGLVAPRATEATLASRAVIAPRSRMRSGASLRERAKASR
jgi:uncharacterized protein (TIGR02444 family)